MITTNKVDSSNILNGVLKTSENVLSAVNEVKQIDTLEQINQLASQVMDKKEIDNLFDLLKQNNMAEGENITRGKSIKTEASENRKIAIAKNKIRRELSYSENNITSIAIKELAANGLSLDKISFSMLNNIIKEIEPNAPKHISPLMPKNYTNNFENAKDFELQLRAFNVAVNDRNISSLEQVKFKLDKVKNLDDEAVINILKLDKPLSLENVYKGKYTYGSNNEYNISEDDWQELTVEIEKSFNRDGININEKAFKFAKGFIENDVPITKENINKAMFLKGLKKYINEESILNEATNNIKQGIKPTEINLFSYQKSIVQALDEFGVKRKSTFESNLNIMEAPINEQNISTMENLFDSLTSFKALKYNVFGDIINKNIEFNVNGINKSFKAAQTLELLEQNSTFVNSKFGDSFNKVKEQLAPLLEALNIKANDTNIKSASILTKNNIDINLENIISVGLIDKKISRVINTLHPNIASNMIKDGIDPLEMHIDEMLEYIEKFNGKYGEDLEDKITEHILELDNKKTLNKETRSSMIDIYKMLNKITKDNSVAIGLSLKKGTELTLGNLLESSTNYKHSKGSSGEISQLEKYDIEVIKEFITNATPDRLEKVIEDDYIFFKDDINDINTKLKQIYNNQELDSVKLENQVDLIKELTKNSSESINWLETNKIFPSIENIVVANNLLINPFFILEDIKKLENKITENDLKNMLEDVEFEKLEDIEIIKRIKKNLSFLDLVNNRENSNKLNTQININDDLAGLNIYVVNKDLSEKVTQKIYMAINCEQLGTVEMFINIGINNIDINLNFEKTNVVIKDSQQELLLRKINEFGKYTLNINIENKPIKNMYKDEMQDNNENLNKIMNTKFQISV